MKCDTCQLIDSSRIFDNKDQFASIPQHVFCRISRSSLLCPSFHRRTIFTAQQTRGMKAFIPHVSKAWLCTWPVMWWNIWVSRQLRYQPMKTWDPLGEGFHFFTLLSPNFSINDTSAFAIQGGSPFCLRSFEKTQLVKCIF